MERYNNLTGKNEEAPVVGAIVDRKCYRRRAGYKYWQLETATEEMLKAEPEDAIWGVSEEDVFEQLKERCRLEAGCTRLKTQEVGRYSDGWYEAEDIVFVDHEQWPKPTVEDLRAMCAVHGHVRTGAVGGTVPLEDGGATVKVVDGWHEVSFNLRAKKRREAVEYRKKVAKVHRVKYLPDGAWNGIVEVLRWGAWSPKKGSWKQVDWGTYMEMESLELPPRKRRWGWRDKTSVVGSKGIGTWIERLRMARLVVKRMGWKWPMKQWKKALRGTRTWLKWLAEHGERGHDRLAKILIRECKKAGIKVPETVPLPEVPTAKKRKVRDVRNQETVGTGGRGSEEQHAGHEPGAEGAVRDPAVGGVQGTEDAQPAGGAVEAAA
jgi:hypothetical protein